MAIATDARQSGVSGVGTSITWNHTVGAALSNSLIAVGCTTGSGTLKSISSVTYNGVALSNTVNGIAATQRDNVSNVNGNLWFLKNPAAGTHAVVVTPSGSCELTGGSSSWSGVDQSTTFNAASPQGNLRGINTNPTTTVTSAAGEQVIDSVGVNLTSGNNPTAVVGSGQTQTYNLSNGAGTSQGLMSDEGGAATVVMDWTGLTTGVNGTGQVCVSLIPASGTPPLTVLLTEPARLRDAVFGAAVFVQSAATRTAGLEERRLRVTDGPPTVDLPLVVTLNEALRLAETIAPLLSPLGEGGGETLRLAETISAVLDPLVELGGDEALKLADTDLQVARVDLGGGDLATPVLTELLHDTEAAPVVVLDPLQAVVGAELLHAAEAITPSLDPLQAVGAELLHLTEIVAPRLDPLQATAAELLHATDTITPVLDPLQAVAGTELLHISEAATVVIDPLQTFGAELLHAADTAAVVLDPLRAPLGDEIGHLAELVAVGPLGNDLSVLVVAEAARLSELLTVTSDLAALVTETARLSEALTATCPLVAVVTETLRLSDPLIVARDLDALVIAAETVRLSESLTRGLDLNASVAEAMRLAETTALTVDPEQATIAEGARLADTDFTAVIFAAGALVTSLSETLRLGELLLPAMDLRVVVTEALRLSDPINVGFGQPLLAPIVAETVRGAELLQVAADLSVSVAESVRLSDPISAASSLAVQITETLRAADLLTPAMDLRVLVTEAGRLSENVASVRAALVVLAEAPITLDDSNLIVLLTTGPAPTPTVPYYIVHIRPDPTAIVVRPDAHAADVGADVVVVHVRPDVQLIHVRPDLVPA